MVKPVLIFLLAFIFTGFQNCSSYERGEKLNLRSLYQYDQPPEFFHDVQIVGKESSDQGWNYQFAATVVSAKQEDQEVNVEIHIMDADGQLVCPRTVATASRANNHIEISRCKSNHDLPLLKVLVKAGKQGAPLADLKIQELNLEGI